MNAKGGGVKAWMISSDAQIDGVCEIVFADSRGKARCKARYSDFFHDIDYTEIDARRTPKFDGRESNPPGLKELVMEHGWSTECDNCEVRVGEDDEPVWSGDRVIECAECAKG